MRLVGLVVEHPWAVLMSQWSGRTGILMLLWVRMVVRGSRSKVVSQSMVWVVLLGVGFVMDLRLRLYCCGVDWGFRHSGAA